MMATKAYHPTIHRDVSRDEPDLCIIYGETPETYIGEWVTGLGFVNLRFPKSHTRNLTAAEREVYNGKRVAISADGPTYRIRIPE